VNEDEKIQHAVRRTVGIAALKRIRRIVDAENALETEKSRRALRLSIFFMLVAVLALAWIAIR
jgi:hypothetical protein